MRWDVLPNHMYISSHQVLSSLIPCNSASNLSLNQDQIHIRVVAWIHSRSYHKYCGLTSWLLYRESGLSIGQQQEEIHLKSPFLLDFNVCFRLSSFSSPPIQSLQKFVLYLMLHLTHNFAHSVYYLTLYFIMKSSSVIDIVSLCRYYIRNVYRSRKKTSVCLLLKNIEKKIIIISLHIPQIKSEIN